MTDQQLDLDDQAVQILSNEGAQCGVCGDEPGDRTCPDCEKCRARYVAALRAAGWAPRPERDAMAAEIRRLRAENNQLATRLAAEERAHGETIDDRDHFHDMADKLAYAVAPEEVIGEHSSMNCPWENALDLITPMAEVEKLREELERQTALAEQGARANRELSRLRAVVAAVIAEHEKGEHNGLAICLHCAQLMFPPPETGIWSESAYPCATLRALGITEDTAAVEAHVVADDSDDPEHVRP
ncbi:hypothetical protein [Streptomyces sp. AM6-12]|uniref:hypothetical protein n=1 Tax=Streptomyces sp. AM6-12 TaxID=3345149 RepID=UPI0037878583